MNNIFKGYRVSTYDILTVAVVAAVGGIIGAYVIDAWAKFIEGVLGPFGAALDNPFFILFYIIIGLLTRKPFLTFIGGMLTGIVEMIAGSLDGSIVLVFTLLQAIGAELGFFLLQYRPKLTTALLSGALTGIGCAICLTLVFGFTVLPAGTMILFYIAMALGDAIIGGGLAWIIYQGILKTGVRGSAAATV